MAYRPDPPELIRRLFRPGVEPGVDWEIEHHLEERADRLVEEGWDPAEARREAERRFGDIGRYRERLRGAARTRRGRRWTMETLGWGWNTSVRRLDEWRGNRNFRRSLWMLSAAVVLMLAIALFNATNLLLLRGHARAVEWGIRRSLGAGAGQLIRRVIVESVILAACAAGAAALLASAALGTIRTIMPREFEFSSVHPFTVEGRALAFAFGLALAAGLVTGLLPALRAAFSRAAPRAPGSQAGGQGPGAVRVGSGLVVAQMALSMTLLVGAGLFLRSFAAMMSDDPGFDAERVALAELDLSERAYPTPEDRRQVVDAVIERLSGLPGVDAVVASVGGAPGGGGLYAPDALYPEGREPVEGFVIVPYVEAPEAYLDVLGTPLLEGRGPRADDRSSGGVVIDRDLAGYLFGEGSALGRRFSFSEDGEPFTVVGVVEELKLGGVDDALSPYAMLRPTDPERIGSTVTVTLRAGDPGATLEDVRRSIREVDAGLPIRTLQTASEALAESASGPRFLLVLVGSLAAVALTLAGVGTYGVLAHVVRQRQREMGIRMALGASAGQIHQRIFRRGVALAVVGVALGALGASALTRFAESLVFGISAADAWSRVGAGALIVTVAMIACWIPARRATRVDPLEVLRTE